MMHGKTKIELYNVNTKIKQIIREENTFQSSVLANYMRSLGEANNNPFASDGFKSNNDWANLVGGILLFKNSIDISGGVVKYMPGGNQMIANGSYNTSNGTSENDPTEMGSWNASESSASASAITQVYDWATNQGNGTISCICLTSQTGGYIGYGNESGKNKSLYDYKRNQNITLVRNTDNTTKKAIVGNIRYDFINSENTLKVRKTRVGISQASVFDGFYIETTFNKATVGNHSGWTTHNFTLSVDGNNIYILIGTSQTLSSGQTGYFYKYSIANDTLEEIAFINSSSQTISLGRGDYGGSAKCKIARGLIFATGNNKIQVFDIATGEYIDELNLYSEDGSFWNNIACNSSNGLVFVHTSPLTDTSNPLEYIYDTVSGACRPTNGTTQIGWKEGTVCGYDDTNDCMMYEANSGIYLYKNPLYLATINNLQSPVTKTAAQTMKVTYTLTEE